MPNNVGLHPPEMLSANKSSLVNAAVSDIGGRVLFMVFGLNIGSSSTEA